MNGIDEFLTDSEREQLERARNLAYRRLALAIVGLDVPSLTSELHAGRPLHAFANEIEHILAA
jgi:hypothetical protein